MDSHITVRDGKCTSFIGDDAVNYVRAELLASSFSFAFRTFRVCLRQTNLKRTRFLHAETYSAPS